VFLVYPAGLSSQDHIPAQNPGITLELGVPIQREISGKNVDDYDVALQAGQFAGITVYQRGIDVVIDVADSSGAVLAEFNSQARIPGEEAVGLTAGADRHYRLSVKPKYSKAEPGRYEVRLEDVRPATDKDRWLFEAHQLSRQSAVLAGKGKVDDARVLATHAVESAEKGAGPNSAYVGELLVNLAELERNKDNFAKSEELFQRAIEVDQAALGRQDPQTAFAMLRLAALYDSKDDYPRAEPMLQESLRITQQTLGPDHPQVVVWLMNLSLLHEDREDYAEALSELQQARAIAEKRLDPDDFIYIGVLNNLADLYRSMKDYDQAEPLVERVIQMIEKTRGPDYPRLSEPLMNLGIIAREKKQYARSLELLWRSESIRERAYGPRNSQTAAVLITIGNLYRAEGEFAKAIEVYARARNILETAAGPYHSLTQLTYVNAAIAFAALGDVNDATEYQAHADALLEHSIDLNLSIGSEREKWDFLEGASERTDRTISVNALLAPNSPAASELAALVLLQRKGRVLDAMSGSFAALRSRMSPDDQKLLDELSSTTAELAKLTLHGSGSTPPEAYQKQIASLEKARDDLEAAISRSSSEFRTHSQAVTLTAVKDAIPARAALLEFAAYRPFDPRADSDARAYGEPHYIAYILRHEGEVQWKELGSAKPIDTLVASLRAALRDPENKNVQHLAREMDSRIMQPLRPLVGDATQLLISPDGELNLIPFEALVDEHQHYLVERYSISYLTTGRDLLRLQVARSSRSAPVIVADPVYGEPASAELATTKPSRSRMSPRPDARRSVTSAGDLSDVYFAPLPGTAVEASVIKAEFPDARLLTGRKATEDAVKLVDAPSILHIATHGFFLSDARAATGSEHAPAMSRGIQFDNDGENPLLRSGLALAGANVSRSTTQPGILTALEASSLNLWGTKLVTLSACDTGIGEVRNGEGVYGLRRAFFLAGAESVVMSLWPVSDYATREMMSSYYKNLKKGLGRGEALRQTELAMLKHKDRRHPFYWASFIQSGEWANLDGQRQ